MRYIIEDKKYRFKSAFDTETGAYVRTGVLDEKGKPCEFENLEFLVGLI